MSEHEINIGGKIRSIRESKKITINKVAQDTKLTSSFISQFERGKKTASIASLQKISKVLNINLSTLFDDTNDNKQGSPHIIKKKDRPKLIYPKPENAIDYLLTRTGGLLEVILCKIEPGGGTEESYSHESDEEFILILHGKAEVMIADNIYILNEGDTITFSSRIPHGWKNIGTTTLEILWITTPPSF